MTLRELINSVDSEQYSDSALYQKLRETKPEYGSNRHIQVKLVNGEVTVTNVHVGLLGDIITYPIDVEPELNISKVQLSMPFFMNFHLTALATQTSQPFGMTSTICKRQR